MWAASSSLWLTSCGSPSLTLPLFFGRFFFFFLTTRCLTHVVRCVRALPHPFPTRLTFDDLMNFQRDSGRVYGTAESGISSASFKVLHLTMDPVFIFIFPTSFPLFHPPWFSAPLSVLRPFVVHKPSLQIFKDVIALICLMPLLQMLDSKSRTLTPTTFSCFCSGC